MQETFKNALEFANYRQTLEVSRKRLKEKMDAKLTYGHNGGIFKIDRSLLNFVEMLIYKDRSENVVLLDINNNPVLVENLVDFREEVFDRYFEVTNEYHEQYQQLKKSRSVEKLIEV
jgi:hypothetical protein